MARKTRKSKSNRKLVLISILLALVLAGGVLLFIQHRHRVVSGTIPSTTPTQARKTSTNNSSVSNPEAGSSDSTSAKATSSAGGSGSVADDSSASATALLAPFGGSFVSNHNPSLSGSADNLAEQSVCNTTPGASCTIKFVNKDGVVKTLSAQTTDGSGATYWNWDVKKSRFSAGSWIITATASLNGQSKSTDDSLTLNVQS